jgi:type VI protein secretion system component VasK
MDKRTLSDQTKLKIVKSSATILSMHANLCGNRVCQDWSGEENQNPIIIFNDQERDDLEFNFQIYNSGLEDYEKGQDFFGDEMSISFVLSSGLNDLAQEINQTKDLKEGINSLKELLKMAHESLDSKDERIAELEAEAIIAMKQHHDLCWKIEKLQRQLAKRGMSQEEKNKTFHHDAKPGQGSFTMQQYKALKEQDND